MDNRKHISVAGSIGQVKKVMFNLYITTADLIAELEKRRPKCSKCNNADVECDMCFWRWESGDKDNFKEAKARAYLNGLKDKENI